MIYILYLRKHALLFTNLFVIAASSLNIMSKFIKSYETLMVARFLSGIFCGLFTGILPLYLNEISPQNLRGLVGTLNQFGIVLGIMITNIAGIPTLLGSDDLWPILVGLMVLPGIAHVILLYGVESPKYLYIQCDKKQKAEAALKLLRDEYNETLVKYELSILEKEKIEQLQLKQVSWSSFLTTSSYRHPLIIAIGVMISQQFSGINAVRRSFFLKGNQAVK